MRRQSPAERADEFPKEKPNTPPCWPTEERLRVAARLHYLQLANQRLNDEKSKLQHQLSHILHRLSSDNFARRRSHIRDFSALVCDILKPASELSLHGQFVAPLASTESVSLVGSNGRVSLTEYSSLSDTYEEIILRQDPVRLVGLELSSAEEEDRNDTTTRALRRLASETETLAVSRTAVDTPASSTSVTVAVRHSPHSYKGSEEELADLDIPRLIMPSSTYSIDTLSSDEDILPSEQYPRSATHTATHTPISLHRYTPSSSLPSRSYKLTSICHCGEDTKSLVLKWLEHRTTEESSDVRLHRTILTRPSGVHKSHKVPIGPSTTAPKRHPRERSVPQPMRQALKRKPKVKVGPSDDFLNDLFASSSVSGDGIGAAVSEEGLHGAVIASKSAEVTRELGSLFTRLHAYIKVRRRCIPIQSIPSDEFQRTLDSLLQSGDPIFDRLVKEDTSSEETRSTAGIPISSLSTTVATPSSKSFPKQIFHATPPHESASHRRTSSLSTEYYMPPNENSNDNAEEDPTLHNLCHAGALSKLSSRFKLWQNYWCVLTEKNLLFYADETESDKWPRKVIDLVEIHYVEKRYTSCGSMKHVMNSPKPRKSVSSVNAINLVLRSGKIHTLRSQIISETQVWKTKIGRALRRVQAEQIVQLYGGLRSTSGWLRRYRRGQSQRVWAMLMGAFLVYARDPRCQCLMGFRDLGMTYMRYPVDLTSASLGSPASEGYDMTDSESDTGINDANDAPRRTLALCSPQNRDPVYLVCATDAEYERWKYHLLNACWLSIYTAEPSTTTTEPEAHFLRLWEQLVRPTYVVHRIHADAPIKEPLSRSFDPTIERASLKLSEKLHSLSTLHVRLPERSLNKGGRHYGAIYRVPVSADKCHLIKGIAQMCFDNIGLKDELFLQLIMQATPSAQALRTLADLHFGTEPPTRRRATRMVDFLLRRDGQRERTASTHRHHTESPRFTSPPGYSPKWLPIIAMWECIAIYSTMFLPSPPVLACLQSYLLQFTWKREATAFRPGAEHLGSPLGERSNPIRERSLYDELCRFAAFCSDMLTRCRIRGGRYATPSCFEVVALSLRNPYTHCLPFSLPIHVHLPSGYEVVSFDGTMKVGQLMLGLVSKLELSEAIRMNLCHCGLYCRISGLQFALGCVPAKPRLIYLEANWNLCDVISLYEKTLTRTDQESDFTLEDMTIDLVFLIHAVAKKAINHASPLCQRIMDIVAHQLHSDLCSGELILILRGTHFLELTALMCRCDHVDYADLQRLQQVNLTHLVNRYFPKHCLLTWVRDDDQALIELKLLLIESWTKVCRETSTPEYEGPGFPASRPRASFAYTMYFWRLHPAGACVRQFACNLINCHEISSDETVWVAFSFERVSILRICTFTKTETQPVESGVVGEKLSGMVCFKQIPLNRIISFGVKQNGTFFLVYSKTSRSEQRQRCQKRANRCQRPEDGASATQKTDNNRSNASGDASKRPSLSSLQSLDLSRISMPESDLETLLFLVRDICEINEICQVLSFYVESGK